MCRERECGEAKHIQPLFEHHSLIHLDTHSLTHSDTAPALGQVGQHLVSTRSAGLFHRVGLDSGAFTHWSSKPMHEAQAREER